MAKLPLRITARVIHGDQVGRTIGFPTANLDVSQIQFELEPGVYMGFCVIDGQKYQCLPYWGPRMIVGELKPSFEIYILNFDQDIYGRKIEVNLQAFLRPPMPMTSLADLKVQLRADVIKATAYFEQTKTDTLSV